MKHVLISVPENEYWSKMSKLIDKRFEKFAEDNKPKNNKSYSINQVAKILHRSHPTIKSLVYDGILKATPDSRILATEVDRYLKESS